MIHNVRPGDLLLLKTTNTCAFGFVLAIEPATARDDAHLLILWSDGDGLVTMHVGDHNNVDHSNLERVVGKQA